MKYCRMNCSSLSFDSFSHTKCSIPFASVIEMLFMSSTIGGSPFSCESRITSIETLPLLVLELKFGSISNLWIKREFLNNYRKSAGWLS